MKPIGISLSRYRVYVAMKPVNISVSRDGVYKTMKPRNHETNKPVNNILMFIDGVYGEIENEKTKP